MTIDQATETDVCAAWEQLALDAAAPTPETWCIARRRLGWSLEFAAREIGISTGHLDHIEVGVRTPDAEMVSRLAEAYGIEAERLEARARAERIPPRYDSDTGTLWLGWLPIETAGFDNAELLTAIGATLRTMRSLSDHHPVHLRDSDLEVVAPLFDLDDKQFSRRVMTYLGLSPAEATALVDNLKLAAS